jgi:hypothetical protein
MKRFILIALFIAGLLGVFGWLFVNREKFDLSGDERQKAKTIIPSVNNDNTDTTDASPEGTSYDESKSQPLIFLEEGETFLQAISVDINKDGMADQVCALKNNSDSNIYLVPGLQNPLTNNYTRLESIRTGVTQTRTLLLYSLDIIGDRTNALICSGMTADNLQLLTVYVPVIGVDGSPSFTSVADLRADGTIDLKEVPRSDAYNLTLTAGESYPIYTYSSDPDAPQTLNQIERIYKWDKALKRYEQASESRIEGKKIESKLVKQLQGGNLASFEKFLDGLWYMPSSTSNTTRYLFFNETDNEIIFHNGSTEEVFTRESGTARRYGVYLTTRNKSISSIRRLIDIELTGIDEIKIRVLEDVKLKIGVASDFDGVYRKMASNSTIVAPSKYPSPQEIRALLDSSEADWTSTDGQVLRTTGNTFTLVVNDRTDTGDFALLSVGGKPVLQLRTEANSKISRFYLIETETGAIPGGERQSLTLTEVSVSISGTAYMGSAPAVFTRKKTNK